MKCSQVNPMLTRYLANEVTPSEKKLIQAHLAACSGCQNELTELSALQSRIGQSLHQQAAQAKPSLQAWSRLQESLANEAPRLPGEVPTTWLERTMDTLKKGIYIMKQQPVTFAAAILIVAIATAAFVPGVRAQVLETFGDWFGFEFRSPNSENILSLSTKWGFSPYAPSYMPDDLDLNGSMLDGDQTIESLGLCYQSYNARADGPFVAITQTYIEELTALPDGKEIRVKGVDARIETVAEGEIEWCLYPQSLTYKEATRLTMLKGDVLIEIIGTYSERQMIRVANSLQRAEPAATQLPLPTE